MQNSQLVTSTVYADNAIICTIYAYNRALIGYNMPKRKDSIDKLSQYDSVTLSAIGANLAELKQAILDDAAEFFGLDAEFYYLHTVGSRSVPTMTDTNGRAALFRMTSTVYLHPIEADDDDDSDDSSSEAASATPSGRSSSNFGEAEAIAPRGRRPVGPAIELDEDEDEDDEEEGDDDD